MPAKNKTNLAKTPPFSRFLSNSRLKYVWYVCTRLYQKSSKIRRQTTVRFILGWHRQRSYHSVMFMLFVEVAYYFVYRFDVSETVGVAFEYFFKLDDFAFCHKAHKRLFSGVRV